MTDIANEYATRHQIMQQDLHNLRAQRRKASTVEARERTEMAIDAKLRELLALREEALTEAGVVL